MTTTAHEDQYTVAPEQPVRQPYDTVAILRRNVEELELALKRQTERAEKAEEKLTTAREDMQSWIDSRNGWMERAGAAEAELARLREQKQKPMGWIDADGDFYHGRHYPNVWPTAIPVYVEPTPAPAVPSVVFMAHNKTSSILFAARKDADQYAASFGPAAGVSVTECAVIGSQSAPQAPAVPELDPMTRLIVSDPKQLKPKKQEPAVLEEWRDDVFAAAEELRSTVRDLKNGFVRCGNCGEQETTSDLDCVSDIDGALELLDGLLQSAPATVAVTAEWWEVISDLLANDGADGGRYDANKWLAARDKARALLQSAEVTK